MISTLIALPYEVARLPLVMVDNSLSDRLPETSGPRVSLDRAIGSADKLAGALLRNRDIAERGAHRIERSEQLVAAARLEQEAAVRREQARDAAATGRQEAARKRKAAQDRVASGLDEADAVEARGKQEAAAKAARSASARRTAADKKAAGRTASVEQRKARADSAVESRKKTAQRAPKAELDEARRTKRSAAEARDDAVRLSDLTEAKRQDRKQD